MTPAAWTVVAVIIVAVLVVGAILWSRRRHSEHLRDRFGREYDRTVDAKGDRSKAEAELAEREKRVGKLDIRPLTAEERREFVQRWDDVEARFVDDPPRAVAFADALVGDVMKARGYPVSDFEQRAGDLSVDHPVVVEHYHKAHDIAVRHQHGQASTEDLRQAMIHYRALFDNLVGAGAGASREPEPSPAAREHETAHH
jgi:FtsZ-interacting cell division protein ZipA